MSAPRRFIRPWQVIEHDERFEVIDAVGVSLAVVHFDDEPSQSTGQQSTRLDRPNPEAYPDFGTSSHHAKRRLSKDEARRLAREIARLPELLRIERGIDPNEA